MGGALQEELQSKMEEERKEIAGAERRKFELVPLRLICVVFGVGKCPMSIQTQHDRNSLTCEPHVARNCKSWRRKKEQWRLSETDCRRSQRGDSW